MLLGCDYLDPVRGVGPKKALKLIQEHETLEKVLEHLEQRPDASKSKSAAKDEEEEEEGEEAQTKKKRAGGIQVPEFWPYQEARKLFESPDVTDGKTVQVRRIFLTTSLNGKSLIRKSSYSFFAVTRASGALWPCADRSEERVRRGAEKLARAIGQKQQGRLDGFFT